MQKKTFLYRHEDGDVDVEDLVELPVRMEVCHDCEGHGTVLHEAIRHHAYTREEFEDEFCDDEDREAYFTRGSKYDVTCPTCKGRNVTPVVDEDRLTDNEKALYSKLEKQWADEAAANALDAQIRRMENGGYE